MVASPSRRLRVTVFALPSLLVLLRLAPTGFAAEDVLIKGDAPVGTAPGTPASTATTLPAVAAGDSAIATPAVDPELERMRKEREKLAAENALAAEKLRRDLFALDAEKQRLSLENSLRAERLTAEMAETRTKLDRISLSIEEINRQSALEATQRRAQLDQELAALRAEDERLRVANSIASQKGETRMAEMRLQEAEFKNQRAALDMAIARLQTQLSLREKTDILHDIASDDQKYTKEPFKDGVLLVSDRRIALNGVIVPSVADLIAERIDYFNNQNTEFPIFIVIDSSPGGSLLAGEKIIKAMAGSQAPVYVVVRSYAASMAAVITTVARRSFAYSNTIILHHQPAWLGIGNLTQQREQLQFIDDWWRRMAQPVAAKMGIPLDEFKKRMYEKNSDGDWREFADTAKKLKWVDEVVSTIWEKSLDKNPDRFGAQPMVSIQLEEKVDEQGSSYVALPRLAPFDAYFLHNPDRYYRLR